MIIYSTFKNKSRNKTKKQEIINHQEIANRDDSDSRSDDQTFIPSLESIEELEKHANKIFITNSDIDGINVKKFVQKVNRKDTYHVQIDSTEVAKNTSISTMNLELR